MTLQLNLSEVRGMDHRFEFGVWALRRRSGRVGCMRWENWLQQQLLEGLLPEMSGGCRFLLSF